MTTSSLYDHRSVSVWAPVEPSACFNWSQTSPYCSNVETSQTPLNSQCQAPPFKRQRSHDTVNESMNGLGRTDEQCSTIRLSQSINNNWNGYHNNHCASSDVYGHHKIITDNANQPTSTNVFSQSDQTSNQTVNLTQFNTCINWYEYNDNNYPGSDVQTFQNINAAVSQYGQNDKSSNTVSLSSDSNNNCKIYSDGQSSDVKVTSSKPEVIVIDEEPSTDTEQEQYSPYGPRKFRLIISLSDDECDNPASPNAEWMYKNKNGLELALSPNTSLLFEHLYNTSSKLNSKVKMKLSETGRRYVISLKEMQMIDVENGEKVSLFRKTWIPDIIQPLGCTLGPYPTLWSPQQNDIELVTLDSSADRVEYNTIADEFLLTMHLSRIQSIQRVQNKKLFVRYAFQKARLLDKNSGNEQRLNEKLLFHGTSRTPPSTIWESEDGFDLRYSRSGMWGIGTYFAENASYSDSYAHHCREEPPTATHMAPRYSGSARQMFVANVLTGNSIEMEPDQKAKKMTRPPVCVESTATNSEELYDSVTGVTGGSRIYVLYKLDMAYPSYLVTYFKT